MHAAVSAMKGSASVGVRVRWKIGLDVRHEKRSGRIANMAVSATSRVAASSRSSSAALRPAAATRCERSAQEQEATAIAPNAKIRVPQID